MGLKCPACERGLTEMAVGDIRVDVCRGGCGGIWFDNFELKKVDETHERQGELLLDIERNSDSHVDMTKRRDCPCCDHVTMKRRFFSVKRKVEIDECSGCGGVWLDAGELRDIRNTFVTEADRKKAFDQYFDDVFGAALREERAAMQRDLEKTRNSVKAFRFICPTHWIPGKQDWGAF